MKILQVNKFHYPRGGADGYFLALAAGQAAAGHEVAVFSMEHPDNIPTPWSRYFVSRVSFNRQSWRDLLSTPGRVIYSLEAKRKFAKLLDDFKPDIIHCHNIYYHLSPSILDAAADRHIPVVMHLHDYNLVAANHAMYAPGGHSCDPENIWPCLKRSCIKDSLIATSLGLFETWLHHDIMHIYKRGLTALIAPSRYMAEMVVRYRPQLPAPKVMYNPFDPALVSYNVDTPIQDYLLYFGRLSEEKGLDILIKAAAITKHRVMIVGSGPEEQRLKDLVSEFRAPVEFVGFKSGEDLAHLIVPARAVVVPSIWRENMPLSMLEAMSLKKPIIASRVGGLPEMVENGVTGLLCNPGDVDDLVLQIKKLDELDLNQIGLNCQARVGQLRPEDNQAEIMTLYQELINQKTPS